MIGLCVFILMMDVCFFLSCDGFEFLTGCDLNFIGSDYSIVGLRLLLTIFDERDSSSNKRKKNYSRFIAVRVFRLSFCKE